MIFFFTAKYLPLLGVAGALLLVWATVAFRRREAVGFEEREPHEIDFAKIHAELIQPQLNTLEAQRRLAISASLLVWGAGAIIAAEIVQNRGLEIARRRRSPPFLRRLPAPAGASADSSATALRVVISQQLWSTDKG